MDYQALQEQVANHFVSTELVPFIPTAITLAEAELNRRLRTRESLTRARTTASEAYEGLPEDFNVMRSVYLVTTPPQRLEVMPVAGIQAVQERTPGAGRPMYFSVTGDALQLTPEPDTDYPLEILYHARLPELSDANPTNWLLRRNPDIYLYGALLQASPYLDKDKRIPVWSSLYESAIEELNVQSERAEFSGGVLKMRSRSLG